MENATEALKMAGSVLLFVLALSIFISMITQARETIDAVIKFSDRESLTIEGDDRFYYLSDSGETERYVGKETIIPSIYRAYKERYKVVFIFHDDDYYLFKKDITTTVLNPDGTKTVTTEKDKKINTIDLANQNIGSDLESRQFLDGIIYGNYEYESGKTKSDFENKFSVKVDNSYATSGGLYAYLTDKEGSKKIKESLGTYILEDVGGTTELSTEDKNEKRVITYEFK